MKPLREALLLVGLSVLAPYSGIAATPSAGNADNTPKLLTELDFGTASAGTNGSASHSKLGFPGWTFSTVRGGSVGLEATGSPTLTGTTVDAMEGSYPVPGAGGQFIVATYNMKNAEAEDVYIEFWAKMPGAKGGCKFVKIFGDRLIPNSYANATIYTNYNGGDYGSIDQVMFGDGAVLSNDSQHGIFLNGRKPQAIGRSYGTAKVLTPQMRNFPSADWGTQWHHFRIHFKFNSGTTRQNEVPDGEAYLEIDGKVYVDAIGLYNRNPANAPIHDIEFFGWAQHNPQPFQLWYHDIRVSTGGFLSKAMRDHPANAGTSLTGVG